MGRSPRTRNSRRWRKPGDSALSHVWVRRPRSPRPVRCFQGSSRGSDATIAGRTSPDLLGPRELPGWRFDPARLHHTPPAARAPGADGPFVAAATSRRRTRNDAKRARLRT
jgi:hypothetical protein